MGLSDQLLNQTGRQQAKDLAEFLKDQNIQKIYVSPLKRALETADLAIRILNLKQKVVRELSEISFGDWEGKLKSEFKNDPRWQERENDFFNFVYPNGESYALLYNRLIPFFEKLKKETTKVAVISHGGVIRCARKYFERINDWEFKTFPLTNRSLYLVSVEDGKIKTKISLF